MKATFTFLFAIIFFVCSAQKEANQWYFGQMASIDFNSGTAIATGGSAMSTTEGSASMADTAGNLLFYTNGVDVWDANHTLMPNGTGLMGGISATQSALIVPYPGITDMYFIFTVDETGGGNGFRYSVVDMNLNGGMGDVSVKNFAIYGPVTEKLAAVKHMNGSSYWIMVHEWGSDAFRAYELNSTGLNQTPVISNTGSVHSTAVIQNTYGQMKFSACGNKLAAAIGYQDIVEVFDFNAATGVVSNPLTISFPDHVYGVEFSPDNSKLYVSNYDPSGTLVQFDLSAGSPPAVIASQVVISQTPDIYPLQLGPDGKIYVTKSWSPMLGVINNPDQAGAASNYNDLGVDLDPNFIGASAALSLPSFVASYFLQDKVECIISAINNPHHEIDLGIFPNPSSGEVELKSKFNFPARLKIQNIFGEDVYKSIISDNKLKLNLNAGIYFISVDDGKNMITDKIIIR